MKIAFHLIKDAKQGVYHTLWPYHLHQHVSEGKKKNDQNSNISPCKNVPNLQKNPLKETKKFFKILLQLYYN
jgi:hypothetical protein